MWFSSWFCCSHCSPCGTCSNHWIDQSFRSCQCHEAVHEKSGSVQETPYEQSFVSAMIPKLEYDALLKARHPQDPKAPGAPGGPGGPCVAMWGFNMTRPGPGRDSRLQQFRRPREAPDLSRPKVPGVLQWWHLIFFVFFFLNKPPANQRI